jgi:S1-C subfamily serine protease
LNEALAEFSEALASAVAGAQGSVVGVGRTGSGFIVSQDRVVTNAHNLRTQDKVEIYFTSGTSTEATTLGVDEEGDLAILSVPTGDRPALGWESAKSLQLGEVVIGLSRPRGRLHAGVGFVAGAPVPFQGPRGHIVTGAVQHSAPLVRGSSGGPLLDARGRLAGVNTHRGGDGFYLALPAGAALKARVDALSRGEVPRRPRLGVALAPPGAARRLRQAVGLPPRDGLLVHAVEEDGPAARAGIRRGDLIVSLGGRPIASLEELASALEAAAVAGGAEVGLVRGSEELSVHVEVAGGPVPGAT